MVFVVMVFTVEQHRQRRQMQKYGRNAANQFVRIAAFRACDYTPAGELNQFQCEADVFAFETARWEDGTGSSVRFSSRPRATVPAEQLAMEAVGNVVAEDGNETRVQLSVVEEGIHARIDAMSSRLDRVLDHSEPPPSQSDDLELMARLQKLCKVRRMNSLLNEHSIKHEVGLKVADKAALLVQKVPRDRLLEILANPQLTATPKSAPRTSRGSASSVGPVAREPKRKRGAQASGARNMSLTELFGQSAAEPPRAALAAPSDAQASRQQADSQAEPREAHDAELEEACTRALEDLDAQEVLKEEADAAEAAENEAILNMTIEETAISAKSVSRTAADSEEEAAEPPRKKCRVLKECRMGLPTQVGIDAIFNVASRSANHLTPAPSDAEASRQQAHPLSKIFVGPSVIMGQ